MGPDSMILVFWMLSFKPTFSLSSFTFIKRLFSSSLSAVRVVSSAYLRLLIFLPAILIPACTSSNPPFLMMYSAYTIEVTQQQQQQQHNFLDWVHINLQDFSCHLFRISYPFCDTGSNYIELQGTEWIHKKLFVQCNFLTQYLVLFFLKFQKYTL